jgi:hypothetical protein
MRHILTVSISIFSLMLVVGCGGGGSDVPATTGPKAEGVYGGALSGSTSNAFEMLVLENDEFWTMYGTQSSPTAVFFVKGFIQGSGTSNNGTFTSSNMKDFGVVPAVSGTVNATYNASTPSVSGTATFPAATVAFNGGAIPGSLYNYNTAASLSTVSGAWALTQLTGFGLALNVAANGSFTAKSSDGCNLSGTVAPRGSGKNVFNVALTFGSAPCALPGQAATGIAVAYPLTSGATQLVVSVIDGTRTFGAAAVGTR